jgi:tape measure domain-containing protein
MADVFSIRGLIELAGAAAANRELDELSGHAHGAERSLENAGKKSEALAGVLGMLGGAVTKAGTLITASVTAPLAGLITGAAHATVNWIKLVEGFNLTAEAMLGSKEAANDLYQNIYSIGKASIYSREALLPAAKQLVGLGVSAGETTSWIQAATDAVSAYGGSGEDIQQITNAFATAHTQGKLSMLTVRQMANSGVNALQILGNQYGKTREEMQDMISAGVVPADEAINLLTKGMEEGTDGANGLTKALEGMSAKMQGKTLSGAFATLRNAVRTLNTELMGMDPTMRSTDERYAESQQRIGQLTVVILKIAEILKLLPKIFAPVTEGVGKLLDKLIGSNVVWNEATGEWENAGGILQQIVDYLTELDPEKAAELGKKILALAAMGPALLILGKAIQGVAGGIKTYNKLAGYVATLTGAKLTKAGAETVDTVATTVNTTATTLNGNAMKRAAAKVLAFAAAHKAAMIAALGVIGVIALIVVAMTKFDGDADAMANRIETVINGIVLKIDAFAARLPGIIETIIPAITNAAVKIVGAFVSVLPTLIPVLVGAFVQLFLAFTQVIGVVVPALIEGFTAILNAVIEALPIVIPALIEGFMGLLNAVIESLSLILPALIEGFISLLDAVIAALPIVVPALIDAFVQIFAALVAALPQIIAALIAAVPQIAEGIKNAFVESWPLIKQAFIDLWEAIKTKAVEIWGQIKEALGGVIDSIKTFFAEKWEAIKTAVTDTWEKIKTAIMTPIEAAKEKVTAAVDAVKTKVATVFDAIKSTVTTVWNGIKTAITHPIETARDVVKGVIDAIKGFFDFSISWPKIPLPHFGVTPKGWSVGDLLKGKLPKLAIDWYAEGGILEQPTVFGLQGNRLMGGGEAGAEAITPIDTLRGYVREEVAAATRESSDRLAALMAELVELTREYLPQAGRGDVLIDGDTLVGSIAPRMDRSLSGRSRAAARGFATA